MQETNSFDQLKHVFRELLTSLERTDTSSFSKPELEAWEIMLSKKGEFLKGLNRFLLFFAGDLKNTREELKKSSSKLLIQATEQLDKVTESTQKVANSVIDRIDRICQMQNGVFEQVNQLKEKIKTMDNQPAAALALEIAGQLETRESEIQMEVMEIMNEMQFQDITSQQIRQVIYLMGEAEKKLTNIGQVLEMLFKDDGINPQEPSGGSNFDPEATLEDREKRQSQADEITKTFLQDKK